MKKMMLVFAGFVVSMFAVAKDKEVIAGKVVTVVDGNTVEVVGEDNETYRIMLHGIDCPELDQVYGDAAKRFLEKLLIDKSVSVEIKGKNRYGVRQGVILIDGEEDPRVELLKEGLAWTMEADPISDLEAIRIKAKEKGKGLWKENNPTPPWVFRRLQTRTQFKSS